MLPSEIEKLTYVHAVERLRAFEPGPDAPTSRVAVLSNVTLGLVETYTRYFCAEEGIGCEWWTGDYDNVMQQVLAPDGDLYRTEQDVVVIALKMEFAHPRLARRFLDLSPEEVASETDELLGVLVGAAKAVRERSAATILVHNVEVPPYGSLGVLEYQGTPSLTGAVRRLNARLAEALAGITGAFVVDVDALQARVGYGSYLDRRHWHLARAPYSQLASKAIAYEYAKFIRARAGRARKCLVLDCDGTLWGGIVGEDGIEGIELGSTYPGSQFVEFQSACLELNRRGVILAIASKNNEADVMEVLRDRPDMLLHEEHFAVIKANWDDKVANLRQIAAELNIGLDALVFADDNEFETELVSAQLPEVYVLRLDGKRLDSRDALLACGAFDTLQVSDEDRGRGEMYRTQVLRESSKQRFESIEDYLAHLEIEVDFESASQKTLPRIAQLTQRTNQFNLTTRRYSVEELSGLLDGGDSAILGASYRDRFGDSGLVGVAILRFAGSEASIDSFLLSCRVLGRGVEDLMLAECVRLARERGASLVRAEYIPTKKNGQVEHFFDQRGFTADGTAGSSVSYVLGPDAKVTAPPS